MSQIGISYTPSSGGPYNFLFSEFSGAELPRTYQASASFSQSSNGASILTGPSFRQKYIWAISTPMTKTAAADLDRMYRAWDLDRSNGLAAAVGVTDQLFSDSVSTSAVFSTPPSYSRMGPNHMMVSFGLAEV
jgi:hypothetical protein